MVELFFFFNYFIFLAGWWEITKQDGELQDREAEIGREQNASLDSSERRKRRSVPGQLPLVDALLNSHPHNKRRHGRASPARVETWPKWDFIHQRLLLFGVCGAALTACVAVFARARLSFHSFKWFNAHLRERKAEMRGCKMKIRIINPTYLLSRSNQLTEPERAFCLQNLMSRDFLRGVGGRKKKKNSPHKR